MFDSTNVKNSFIASQILGDGHLRKGNRQIELAHSEKQKAYLLWKMYIAENLGFVVKDGGWRTRYTNLGPELQTIHEATVFLSDTFLRLTKTR